MKANANNITKFIASDMDHTLAKSDGKFAPAVRKQWGISLKAGVKTTILTGQTVNKVNYTFKSNELPSPDYIVGDMGTVLHITDGEIFLHKFLLPNVDVLKIVREFYLRGGEEKYVRISTGEKIIVTDCKEVYEFSKPNEMSNLIITNDININLNNGEFVKVILMGSREFVNELAIFASDFPSITAINTGKSNFGDMGYYRLELLPKEANKGTAFNILLKHLGLLQYINVLGMGDERPDIPLALSILNLNQYPTMSGSFAVIDNGTEGSEALKKAAIDWAKTNNCLDKLWVMPSVEKDGAALAIKKWLH